jgi:hypothetical protein
MGLFKADLFRSFAIGFALGGMILSLVLGCGLLTGGGSVVPAAIAAPVPGK